jgi:hypothetical protein
MQDRTRSGFTQFLVGDAPHVHEQYLEGSPLVWRLGLPLPQRDTSTASPTTRGPIKMPIISSQKIVELLRPRRRIGSTGDQPQEAGVEEPRAAQSLDAACTMATTNSGLAAALPSPNTRSTSSRASSSSTHRLRFRHWIFPPSEVMDRPRAARGTRERSGARP